MLDCGAPLSWPSWLSDQQHPPVRSYGAVLLHRPGRRMFAASSDTNQVQDPRMTTLILGLAVFIGSHLVPTVPSVRDDLRSRFGVTPYMILFSLVSIVGFALIVIGYGEARGLARANPQLWVPPSWGRHVTYALMLPAMILVVAAQIPSRIRDAVRHPMLLSIKLWALAHLFVRGDLASLLLFGSLLAYAVYDRISVKTRAALGPLGARTGTARNDAIVVAVGLALYLAMLFGLHGWLIGVNILQVRFAP